MEKYNLSSFKGGWFLGSFEPTLYDTFYFEVGIKEYKAGTVELAHFHKVATEWTVITSGKAKINDIELNEGDILQINPNEVAKFEAITDVKTTVVKIPSIKNDKFLI